MKKTVKLAILLLVFALVITQLLLLVNQSNLAITDVHSFTLELNKRGYKIESIGDTKSHLPQEFSVSPNYIKTDKASFCLYVFLSEEEALKARASVSEDGSSIKGQKMRYYINWAGHPHFYQKGNILVEYVGRNPKVLYDMHNMMGRQFAGAKLYELPFKRGGK